MKVVFFILSICFSLSVFGQKSQLLKVDTKKTTTLKLSEIAEKVVSFPLSEPYENASDFYYLPNQYLYVKSHTSIYQYDASGKFIRKINGGGYVDGFAIDEKKKELHIPVTKGGKCILKCFDYSGKFLREYPIEGNVSACVHFKNKFWMVQHAFINDTIYHRLSNLDYQTGKVKDCGTLYKFFIKKGLGISAPSVFSVSNGNLYVSVNSDSVMYQVSENERLKAYKCWSIHPPVRFMNEKGIMDRHYLAGDYLFVEYARNAPEDKEGNTLQSYLYVKSIKHPSKAYNVMEKMKLRGDRKLVSGVQDDIYHPSDYIEPRPLNLPNHLFFTTKKKDEQTGEEKIWVHIVRVK